MQRKSKVKRTTCSYPRGLPLGKTKAKNDQIKNFAVVRNRINIIVATSSEPKSGFSSERWNLLDIVYYIWIFGIIWPWTAMVFLDREAQTDEQVCNWHHWTCRPASTMKVETKTTNLGQKPWQRQRQRLSLRLSMCVMV